jgi:hypothetical protein
VAGSTENDGYVDGAHYGDAGVGWTARLQDPVPERLERLTAAFDELSQNPESCGLGGLMDRERLRFWRPADDTGMNPISS